MSTRRQISNVVLWMRLGLIPLAAAGLVVIMVGAVVVTAITQNVSAAVFPLVIGVVTTAVALGRRTPVARVA